MSEIEGKYIIHFKLRSRTNLHIGTGKVDMDTDALCQRNASGEIVISGTTLAGVFRCILERLYGESDPIITEFFGYVDEQSSNSQASHIYFEDAVIEDTRSPHTDIRDGIGINRGYQSAQYHCKYDRETVFKGAFFPCIITVNLTASNKNKIDTILNYLRICLYTLNEGLSPLGGGASAGLGFCSIESAKICFLDFMTRRDNLQDFLLKDFYDGNNTITLKDKDGNDYFQDFSFTSKISVTPSQLKYFNYCVKIEYNLETVEPLLINGPRTNEEDVDFKFVTTGGECFIPGSSFKGPLRSRAEMILRTMGDNSICDPVANPCPQSTPCRACEIFGYQGKKSSILVSDLEACENPSLKYFTHNKIDRFTGGTIANALFDERLVFNGTFKGTMVIDSPDLFTIRLLIHLFKDLYLEDIRMGHGKTNGYGKIKGKITKLQVFAISLSKIDRKPLSEYGLTYNKEEGIFQIIEITDIYFPENKKVFSSLIKAVKSKEWVYE
ncbi:MAG: hypothetical protein IBX72_09745 [Nitrospirae bacterium]|nr:hypothetical protein [Nitrospirota bacterium]